MIRFADHSASVGMTGWEGVAAARLKPCASRFVQMDGLFIAARKRCATQNPECVHFSVKGVTRYKSGYRVHDKGEIVWAIVSLLLYAN